MAYDLTKGGKKKLLYVAKDRNTESLDGFLIKFPKACKSIKHVRPDMWPAYLKVINQKVPHASQVLDPFHVLYKT